jgi:hypothetical protein
LSPLIAVSLDAIFLQATHRSKGWHTKRQATFSEILVSRAMPFWISTF